MAARLANEGNSYYRTIVELKHRMAFGKLASSEVIIEPLWN